MARATIVAVRTESSDVFLSGRGIDAAKLVQGHIELLHTYNEVK